ncbi:MAG: DNA polymerase III subunit alpha [Bacilli bacterium]
MKYVPLQVKTSYSLLSSLNNIKEFVSHAKELGYTSLTITDDNMYGVMEFYKECKKNDIKPIIGLELKLKEFYILLYAKDYNGYKSLIKLVSKKNFKELDIEDLTTYNKSLICVIPCVYKEKYNLLKDIYKDIYFGYKNTKERELLKEFENKLVYINNVLYLEKKDSIYLDYVYAIRDGKKYDEERDRLVGNDNYLKELNEINKISPIIDIENTIKIKNMCNVEFNNSKNLLPKFKTQSNLSSYEYLIDLCKRGLKKRLNNNLKENYIERLKYELSIINKLGFSDYFLVVWDFIKYSKNNNILVGPGRGSAAGSLVSFCLGITDVDPLKYNLLFERFLNPERITMPDIDIDFPDDKREQVIDYVIAKYGKKKVAQIITFGTLGPKQAIRDVGRILDVPIKLVDKVAKLLPNNVKISLADNYKNNNDLRKLIDSSNELKKMYEISIHIEGIPRHTSIHAAGVIISDVELDDIIPLDKSTNDVLTTGYSMDYLEELGLLKMDFLGITHLATMNNIINDIVKNGDDIDINNIDFNDKKTIELFKEADTIGVFQFESKGMMNLLQKMKPSNFEDIVVCNAIFRPGPMGNIPSYIKRREGKEKITYIHDDLEEILKPTYGIIIYQEQIMQIANVMAGYSLGEADVLRRAMSKKKVDILREEKEKFVFRSIKKGYAKEAATRVYDLIFKFANYGFNRSHSVAYSMIGFKMAYLKSHYPKYFMSNLLTSVIGSEVKTREYIYECRKNDINILKPSINLSMDKYMVEDLGIRFSLSTIRNVGIGACKIILEERNKSKFTDIFDFVSRTYGKSVTKGTIESLIDAGCFSDFGYNKKTLHHNIDNMLNYAELTSNLDESLVEKPEMEVISEYSNTELMSLEERVFGFYLSNHPITKFKGNYKNIISLSDLNKYLNQEINLLLYIESVKVIDTKNKEKMAFISCSDELSNIDLTVFPNLYKDYSDLKKGNVILVKGKVERRLAKLQIIAIKIKVID